MFICIAPFKNRYHKVLHKEIKNKQQIDKGHINRQTAKTTGKNNKQKS